VNVNGRDCNVVLWGNVTIKNTYIFYDEDMSLEQSYFCIKI
jgi:hypothetical protein